MIAFAPASSFARKIRARNRLEVQIRKASRRSANECWRLRRALVEIPQCKKSASVIGLFFSSVRWMAARPYARATTVPSMARLLPSAWDWEVSSRVLHCEVEKGDNGVVALFVCGEHRRISVTVVFIIEPRHKLINWGRRTTARAGLHLRFFTRQICW